MMLQYSEVQPMFITSSEDDPANDVGLDVTTIFQKTNKEICDIPDSSSNISKSSSSSTALCNNIYVCTFCQVFSPIFNIVSEHISSSHSDSLPPEASPSSFVSKLQALNANAGKKKGKVGRPKKNREISLESPVPKQLPAEPIPRPDGLFWCKKCLRNFRKPRQLMQHICLDLEEQDSDFNDSPVPSEDEFRTWVDVDPVPWSRMERRTKSRLMLSMDTSLEKMDCISDIQRREISENKVVPNWREDPTYIPLFCNENEKSAFEKHLKSIDYTCVDALFEKEEKSCRSSKKGNCVSLLDVMYSCYICKKVLKSLSHIRLHCLTHTDLKPFTCPKCTYRTNSKGSLYIHMRKHTGNMFCCSFCDFQCVKRSHLLEHEATHSSVTQFCKLCKNSYKTFKSLIAHIKKYHNNPGGKKYIKSLTGKLAKEFKCSICNKKFKSSEILEKHSHVCHDSDLISVGKVINLEENLIDKNIENLNIVIQNSECLENVMLNSTNLSCITQNSENLDSIIQNPENLDSVVQNPENVDSTIQNPENVDNVVQINKPDSFEQLIENVECNVDLSKDPSVEMVLSNFQQQDQSHSVIHNSECLDSIVQNSENLDCIMQNSKNLGNVMQINKSSSLEQLIENVKCNVVLSKDPLVEMVLNNFQQHSQSQSVLQNPENLDSAMQINKPSSLEQLIENVKCNVVLSKDPLVEMVLNNFLQQGQSHSVLHNSECLDSIIQNSKNLDCIMQNSKNLESVMQINEPSSLEQLNENVKCNVVLSKDPLVEMVLNNFLQQGQSQCTPSSGNLLENFPARRMSRLSSESSILEECQKTLDFELLSECLQSTDFSNECNEDFDLQSNNCSLQSNSKSSAENSGHLQQISANKSEESKPVEIKLFEKCRRAPAYVCCVCSSIYICSSTLKAHLKEHVNITSSTLMDQPEEQFEPSRMIETTNALENVCEMLEASSAESCSIDEELEKLYTSSLDKMWYLPGLSVVLQHDPALFDPALDDDISNFSMTDKYDASQDLCAKGEDENVLKCFDEI